MNHCDPGICKLIPHCCCFSAFTPNYGMGTASNWAGGGQQQQQPQPADTWSCCSSPLTKICAHTTVGGTGARISSSGTGTAPSSLTMMHICLQHSSSLPSPSMGMGMGMVLGKILQLCRPDPAWGPYVVKPCIEFISQDLFSINPC